MTRRAIVIGLAGAVIVAAVGFFNDMVMHQTFLFSSYMPLSIFGAAVLFLMFVNPVLHRVSPKLALSGRELALVAAIVLPACCVSSRNFIHHFTTQIMTPRFYARTEPGWQAHRLVERVPSVMLAGVRPEFSADDIVEPLSLAEALCRPSLLAAGLPLPGLPGAELSGAQERIVERVPPEAREDLKRALSELDPDRAADACQRAVSRALNAVVRRSDLHETSAFERLSLSRDADKLLELESLSEEDVRRLNRHLIDAAFAGRVRSLVAKEDYAVTGFQRGLRVGSERISLSKVPWHAWTRTLLLFWVPLVVALSAAFVGLALVVHRRWSEHEHLPYPIVRFVRSLFPEKGRPAGSILRDRLFWVPAAAVVLFHLNNYAQLYWPQQLVEIPRRFDFRSLSYLVPALRRGGDWGIMNPTIYFTAIGLAYFVANDVSLSIGIAPFVYAVVAGVFAGYGVALSGGWYNSLRPEIFMAGGAYIGTFFIVAYAGRRHYLSTFRRGLFLAAEDEVRPAEVWGARISIVATAVTVALLVIVGVRVQWAIFFVAATLMIFVATSRVLAETGSFLLHPHTFPGILLWGFVGAKVLGPQQMLVILVVGSVVSLGFHVNMMPMIVQGLKLAADTGQGVRTRPGRTAALGSAAFLLALVVAIPVALYLQYDLGVAASSDGWTRNIPHFAFDPIVAVEERLEAQGVLEEAGNLTGLRWLGGISPNRPAVIAFLVTFALVILFEALRLRWPGWPLHPVMFIFAGWWHSRVVGVSVLIGWLVKVTVTKYGGAATCNKLKPLMLGLIAGDMLAGILLAIVAGVYYFVTGTAPKGYWVLPG